MQRELWVFTLGAIAVIAVISTLNVMVVSYQRVELTALRDEMASQRATIASLNSTLTDTDDRLTFLAQKLNPLIGAKCHVDQIFYSAREIPDNYAGHVFPAYDYVTDYVYGIGIICR